MTITICGGQWAAECEKCRAGKLCMTRLGAEAWIAAHICRGAK